MRRRFLKTPLLPCYDPEAEEASKRKGLPFAIFIRQGKRYGLYRCELPPGLELSERGILEARGVLKGLFAKLELNHRLNPGAFLGVVGRAGIYVAPVPIGEERYLHRALCRIFTAHLRG